jgi:hypothetical protein
MKQIFLPTLILAVLILLTSLIPSTQIFHPYKWILLLFFWMLSYTTQKITNLGMKQDRIKFQNYYFITMIIRLGLCVIFVLIALFNKVQNPMLFISTFFIFYFFHIVFEILHLLANLRADTKASIRDE